MTNLEKFNAAIEPLSYCEKSSARNYLLGYIIDSTPTEKFDRALQAVMELITREATN